MINLNHLRYFHLTAQLKSVTRAAESLSISQPSLSQQLSVFEESVGFQLYYRNGRNFDLTPKGQMLFEKTLKMFVNVEDINNFITKKSDIKEQQQYSIAVSDEIERPFISDLLGKLVNRVSVDHKFQIISKPQSEIAPEFSVGKKYDILITNREIKKIKPVKAWDLPVNLITSKKLVETYKVKNTGLKSILAGLGEKLVIPTQGTLLREEMEDYFVQHKIETEVIFESNILGCVTRAIKQKLGSGLLPAPYVAEELKSKDLVLLGPAKGFWQHQIFLYTQTPFEKDLMAQKINNAIQESLNFE